MLQKAKQSKGVSRAIFIVPLFALFAVTMLVGITFAQNTNQPNFFVALCLGLNYGLWSGFALSLYYVVDIPRRREMGRMIVKALMMGPSIQDRRKAILRYSINTRGTSLICPTVVALFFGGFSVYHYVIGDTMSVVAGAVLFASYLAGTIPALVFLVWTSYEVARHAISIGVQVGM